MKTWTFSEDRFRRLMEGQDPLEGIEPEYAFLNHQVWTDIAPEFVPAEFEEPEKMDVGFLYLFHQARIIANVPFRIIDTVRVDPRSAHGELPCSAADVQALNARERSRIVRAAYLVGFTRVGIYPGTDGPWGNQMKKDGGGVHMDSSSKLPQDVCWTRRLPANTGS